MKRASLTPSERRSMMADQHRRCALCLAPIGKQADGTKIPCIAEHWNQVAMGNYQKPDYLLCKPCADRKTFGTKATSYGSDAHARAKVHRIRKKLAGEKRKGKPIASRPFPKPPEGYTAWPSRTLPGRKMREAAK